MSTPVQPTVRIGSASGFWGDSSIATPQLLQVPGLQYLVYDYLAETTMSILARARMKDASFGYATDFVHAAMAPHLGTILKQGVRVVANAGGLNPQACRDALLAVAAEQGLSPRIAVVEGDNVLDQIEGWIADGTAHMLDGARLPTGLLSANAYTGAQPIRQALDMGADIVIAGRCVDSAVVVGILAHAFDWDWDSDAAWDRLANATLAGHVVECGAQATGGLFTDWQDVPAWDNMGYPVIDCAQDGSFVLSKPEGTGGLIHPGAVSEQILYEVGDPANYLMPDVTCDFRQVQVRMLDAQHIAVGGAKGRPPGTQYKGNVTWREGFQISVLMAIRGIQATAKAHKTADAILTRCRRLMRERGFDDFAETAVELLGCEALYGANAQALPTREVVLRIAARHSNAKALAILQREVASAGTSMGPGTRSTFSGRSDVQAVIKVASFLVNKAALPQTVRIEAQQQVLAHAAHLGVKAMPAAPAEPMPQALPSAEDTVALPLVQLAWARSGDKGDDENIAVIARNPAWLPLLRQQLTADRVAAYFAHLIANNGSVERFDVPGLHAMNFLLHHALGGGGVCSLRSDPLGKSYAQMLLDIELEVPVSLARQLTPAQTQARTTA